MIEMTHSHKGFGDLLTRTGGEYLGNWTNFEFYL